MQSVTYKIERGLMVLISYQKDLSAFTKHPYRQKRLKQYYSQMSKDNEHVLIDDNVRDMLLAQGFSTEEAPRSIYKVEKLYEALSGYAPHKAPKPRPGAEYQHGVALAFSSFARKGDEERLHVLPFTPETIVKVTSNPSGSPGLTNYGCTKAESQTRALERGLQTLRREKKPEPCLAFKRTQFKDKTRLVWGYPYSMTVIEGLVAKPLIEKFKRRNSPMAFAIATGALGTKLRVASYHRKWAYSLDMSQFDATISSELIHVAFKILRTWFDDREVEPVSGKTVDEIFKLIENYFIHTTIVMPDGNIYYGKDHGVPSGSYFTQMIDSVVNVIIGGAISSHFKLNVSKREVFVLGDDLMLWSNRKVDLDAIADYANTHFGVKMHGSEKSNLYHYDEVIHYLGRDWDNGLPTLDESEVLKRMVHPETFRKYDRDPQRRERQVKMLLLAYAATYRSAWRIAYKLLDPSGRNIHRGCANTDVNTYIDHGHYVGEVEPSVLTGLERFRRRYILSKTRGDIPNTALQYWL
jgi:hypothetical protein